LILLLSPSATAEVRPSWRKKPRIPSERVNDFETLVFVN
jgi:hypothetical protein